MSVPNLLLYFQIMDRLGFHGTISDFFAKLKNNSSFIIDDPVSTDVLSGHSNESKKLVFKTVYLLIHVLQNVIILTCIKQ